jgi:molecular chaperone DnaK
MRTTTPPTLGIDLGTTYSVMAWVDETGRPQTLANLEGDRLTPSAVLIERDDMIVGKEALRALDAVSEHVALHAKRELGKRFYPRSLGGRQYPPEAIQAAILNKLRMDATRQIGRVTQAVITVPAYFDEFRRKATQDAGYMAGLEVIDIINEPTAAAISFGLQRLSRTPDMQPRNVLVYDLGGGTFDVTALEVSGHEFTALATDGDVHLGGIDWDDRIVARTAELFRERHGFDPRDELDTKVKWWRECEEAKRTLSIRRRALMICEVRGIAWRHEIAREDFETWTIDLLERTRFTVQETVAASGLDWNRIHDLILVGGATRMPSVRAMLRQLFAREPDASISPDEAVAHGAAVHANACLAARNKKPPRILVRNINSHSLGVSGTDSLTRQSRVAVLIPRNSRLPSQTRRVFKTQKQGQHSVLVPIVEGESLDPRECIQLGECVVTGLPPDLPAQTPVEVVFQYAQDGRLEVSVSLIGVESSAACEIIRENGMSPAQLRAWRQHIARLPADDVEEVR